MAKRSRHLCSSNFGPWLKLAPSGRRLRRRTSATTALRNPLRRPMLPRSLCRTDVCQAAVPLNDGSAESRPPQSAQGRRLLILTDLSVYVLGWRHARMKGLIPTTPLSRSARKSHGAREGVQAVFFQEQVAPRMRPGQCLTILVLLVVLAGVFQFRARLCVHVLVPPTHASSGATVVQLVRLPLRLPQCLPREALVF